MRRVSYGIALVLAILGAASLAHSAATWAASPNQSDPGCVPCVDEGTIPALTALEVTPHSPTWGDAVTLVISYHAAAQPIVELDLEEGGTNRDGSRKAWDPYADPLSGKTYPWSDGHWLALPRLLPAGSSGTTALTLLCRPGESFSSHLFVQLVDARGRPSSANHPISVDFTCAE